MGQTDMLVLWIRRCPHDRIDWGGAAETNHRIY